MEETMSITEEKLVEDLATTVNDLPQEGKFKLLYIAKGMGIAFDLKNGGDGSCSQQK